jgi:ParB-like chromosome segregation protein Spo0J
VKGHGRLHAARLLQVEGIPIEYQDYATEAEEYADLIADNRIAELAEPDEEMLAELLTDDMFADFDLDLTGFDALSLDDMLKENDEPVDLSDDLEVVFKIEIDCDDEMHQEKLFMEFEEKGLKCRLLTL